MNRDDLAALECFARAVKLFIESDVDVDVAALAVKYGIAWPGDDADPALTREQLADAYRSRRRGSR